jgi:hypothetical protein
MSPMAARRRAMAAVPTAIPIIAPVERPLSVDCDVGSIAGALVVEEAPVGRTLEEPLFVVNIDSMMAEVEPATIVNVVKAVWVIVTGWTYVDTAMTDFVVAVLAADGGHVSPRAVGHSRQHKR